MKKKLQNYFPLLINKIKKKKNYKINDKHNKSTFSYKKIKTPYSISWLWIKYNENRGKGM